MEKKTFTIDGNNFSDLSGFYDEVQSILTKDFRGFGRNLNALTDIMRGSFLRFEYGEEIEVVWKSSEKSKMDLGWPETIKYRTDALNWVHPSNLASAEKWLEEAKNNEGPTLFDIVVTSIRRAENVTLVLA